MLAIAVGVTAWFLLQSPPTLAFAARDWVVVGNLHNLTGDKLFDQSVDSALRISLEQSQYVNVLPELSVQQALQRMELNPDKTDVTRAIGSQVALREGARALILPTVADVGGRVRVTAEVIDPNTQATVYSVSADGLGAQSVLPSLDSVGKQLRGKLGEALAMVSKQSQPLAQVATPDLNALRAYSLGEQAYNVGNFEHAKVMFVEALRIDPHFALAHVKLAKIFDLEDQPSKVLQQIQAAQADRTRLSPREALYVDAWGENYVDPQKALEKWKLLASVYPDYFPGLGSCAFFLWNDSNDFVDAISYLKQAISAKNPHRTIDQYFIGALYLEADDYPRAMHAFSDAVAGGLHLASTYYASAYAAQRDFKHAQDILQHSNSKNTGIVDTNMRVAIALDQGNWSDGNNLLSAVQSKAEDQRLADEYEVTKLSLRALDDTSVKAQISALTGYISRTKKALDHAGSAGRGPLGFRIVLAAYLAARAGNVDLAKRALDAAKEAPGDISLLRNLRQVAEAEIDRASGHPEMAISELQPLVNGRELYVTHVALMDAYADAKDNAHALSEARWLAEHRGRAYAENSMQQLLTPFNVFESNLALLEEAQFALALGERANARKFASSFRNAWPDLSQIQFVAKRYKKLMGDM